MEYLRTDISPKNLEVMRPAEHSPCLDGSQELITLTSRQVSLFLIMFGDDGLHSDDDGNDGAMADRNEATTASSDMKVFLEPFSRMQDSERPLNAFERHKAALFRRELGSVKGHFGSIRVGGRDSQSDSDSDDDLFLLV
jgi:hypothetical protein